MAIFPQVLPKLVVTLVISTKKTLITVIYNGALKIQVDSTHTSDVYFGQKLVKKYQYRHIDTFSDTVSVSVLIHFVEEYLYRHINNFKTND